MIKLLTCAKRPPKMSGSMEINALSVRLFVGFCCEGHVLGYDGFHLSRHLHALGMCQPLQAEAEVFV